jgi:hypothetical protein
MWCCALRQSEFDIDWLATESLWSRTSSTPPIMLVSRIGEGSTQVYLGDVLAALAGGELEHLSPPLTITGYVAEALFESLDRRQLILGFQASGSDIVLRRELYRIGQLLASFDYTDRQQRELRLWPRRTERQLRIQLAEEAERLRAKGFGILRFVPKITTSPDGREASETT